MVPWYSLRIGFGLWTVSRMVSRSLRHLFIFALISVEAFESACR